MAGNTEEFVTSYWALVEMQKRAGHAPKSKNVASPATNWPTKKMTGQQASKGHELRIDYRERVT